MLFVKKGGRWSTYSLAISGLSGDGDTSWTAVTELVILLVSSDDMLAQTRDFLCVLCSSRLSDSTSAYMSSSRQSRYIATRTCRSTTRLGRMEQWLLNNSSADGRSGIMVPHHHRSSPSTQQRVRRWGVTSLTKLQGNLSTLVLYLAYIWTKDVTKVCQFNLGWPFRLKTNFSLSPLIFHPAFSTENQ